MLAIGVVPIHPAAPAAVDVKYWKVVTPAVQPGDGYVGTPPETTTPEVCVYSDPLARLVSMSLAATPSADWEEASNVVVRLNAVPACAFETITAPYE